MFVSVLIHFKEDFQSVWPIHDVNGQYDIL